MDTLLERYPLFSRLTASINVLQKGAGLYLKAIGLRSSWCQSHGGRNWMLHRYAIRCVNKQGDIRGISFCHCEINLKGQWQCDGLAPDLLNGNATLLTHHQKSNGSAFPST
eukprot:scaffold662_cov364-Pavlova_lutheri.AAC.52